MKALHIFKIGGNIINDTNQVLAFLKKFNEIKGHKLLVHGGGVLATQLAEKMGIKQTIIEGRRITDKETLDTIVMVYAGLINKNIVAKLQMLNCNAMGLCGADSNIIKSIKRPIANIDFGYVGDILPKGVDALQIKNILDNNIIPIISPVTHDGKGNLLNTNADTIASAVASAMSLYFQTTLTYCFEKKGVLSDPQTDESYLPELNKETYLKLKNEGIISKGMIPKLDNAFRALENGIEQIQICHANNITTNKTTAFIGTIIKL